MVSHVLTVGRGPDGPRWKIDCPGDTYCDHYRECPECTEWDRAKLEARREAGDDEHRYHGVTHEICADGDWGVRIPGTCVGHWAEEAALEVLDEHGPGTYEVSLDYGESAEFVGLRVLAGTEGTDQ